MENISYSGGGESTEKDSKISLQLDYSFSDGGRFAEDTALLKRIQLYDVWLWKKFAGQFRIDGADDKLDARHRDGWRGEFWGKMMRGASMMLSYSWDETLYGILTDSVKELLMTADDDGRIATYSRDNEFNSWDIWCRKYVLLGLQYYLEVCREPSLPEQIVKAMCRHADCIIAHIGSEADGKKPINKVTTHWGGLNSSSILEPFVRLWNLTGERRYLDFATYIVSEGGCDGGDIFELAYRDEKSPFEYPYVKAYEMMSCFEGLIEYYRATGIEKYKTAAVNFGYRILGTDVTVIGCCGSTNELFDNSAKMQTKSAARDDIMQETCVTVTWMKLCHQLLRLTGDSVFADAMERSFYNAYLGALNTHGSIKAEYSGDSDAVPAYIAMPFDSYSPLTADIRGRRVGGRQFFPDRTYYGCCACIGSAGLGAFGRASVTGESDALDFNFYIDGKLGVKLTDGRYARFVISGGYPYSCKTRITLGNDIPGTLTLRFRIPSWSAVTELTVCGEKVGAIPGRYASVTREWKAGDTVEIGFDSRVRAVFPPYKDGPDAGRCIAFERGPVMLAKDRRLADNLEQTVSIAPDRDYTLPYTLNRCLRIPDARLCVSIPVEHGIEPLTLIDYSSAGKTYSAESECAVWLRGKVRKPD